MPAAHQVDLPAQAIANMAPSATANLPTPLAPPAGPNLIYDPNPETWDALVGVAGQVDYFVYDFAQMSPYVDFIYGFEVGLDKVVFVNTSSQVNWDSFSAQASNIGDYSPYVPTGLPCGTSAADAEVAYVYSDATGNNTWTNTAFIVIDVIPQTSDFLAFGGAYV